MMTLHIDTYYLKYVDNSEYMLLFAKLILETWILIFGGNVGGVSQKDSDPTDGRTERQTTDKLTPIYPNFNAVDRKILIFKKNFV